MITITNEAVCERGLGWYGVVKVGSFATKKQAKEAQRKILEMLMREFDEESVYREGK